MTSPGSRQDSLDVSIEAALPLVAALIGIYMISQFLRNSMGVIAPDIAQELSLGPQSLGVLSSAFFVSFAAAQLPVGAVIDRFGAKRAMLGSLSLAVAGAVLFAYAETFAWLTVARILMGLGCSTFYVAPLAIYARRFSGDRFARLVGLQLGIGSLGALLATAPFAYVAAAFGWRVGFWVAAALAVAVGVVVAWVVPRQDVDGIAAPPSVVGSFLGFAEAFRTPGVWPLFAMNLATYSSFVTVLALWGGPLLADLHGLDVRARGHVLLGMATSQIVAVLAWGAMDRRFRTRKRPVVLGALLTSATLLVLAATATGSIWQVAALLALLGITTGYVPILVAHGKELFPQHLVGRGITLLNLANMGGVFVMQMSTALVMGAWGPKIATQPLPAEAYRTMFVVIGVAVAAAVACYSRAPETKR